jgi:hypothetical protein
MLSSWAMWIWTGWHSGMPQLPFTLAIYSTSLQLMAYGLATCLQVRILREVFAIHTDPTTGLPRRAGHMSYAGGRRESHGGTTPYSHARVCSFVFFVIYPAHGFDTITK